jgi:tetratricopeptide (TPR) repeat protein
MKSTRSFILRTVCVTALGFWLVGLTKAGDIAPQDEAKKLCSTENRNQYYQDFLTSYEGDKRDRAKALEAANKYLSCPANSNDQEENLAKLNLAVGRMLSLKGSYSEAIPYFLKAASYNSSVKSSPQTYADLAEAYEEGPYAVLSAQYRPFAGKDETNESLLALENIFQIVDRMIDAYARAVSLAGVELAQKPRGDGLRVREGRSGPTDWVEDLTDFYKFRHNNSSAGLKELISTIRLCRYRLSLRRSPRCLRGRSRRRNSSQNWAISYGLTRSKCNASITAGPNVVS